MLQKTVLLILLSFFGAITNAQKPTIILVDTSKNVSIRGLSVVDDNIIWCSGSNGAVARSVDGGKSFVWQTVAGYEKRDFRDIEAFDANTAIIMGIAEPAIILKTKDGGQTWKKVFEDSTKGMFLDAMDFVAAVYKKDNKITKRNFGIVLGDPIAGNPFVAMTVDEGDHWQIDSFLTPFEKGEAFFASSGTNVKIYNLFNQVGIGGIFVSGGNKSRLSYRDQLYILPIIQGKVSTGANSVDVWKNNAVVVGGDFANVKDTTGNCVLVSFNKEPEFTKPQTPPHGYRSCVIYINEKTLLTCGTSGVDVSYDGGKNWQLISTQSFHVVQKARNGKIIFLAGSNGKIARLKL